ncbi:ABC transporter permease [[Mycoplasma] testudinis]|uniref:ABC transporter permease n=1 Tax=[Mycoplasma] testudinis TaxID=33924 RepID=UPI000480AB1B|nr:ABC transporter permease [[Mycoplasma] testudinis]
MTEQEFNKRYGLNDSLKEKIVFYKSKDSAFASLAGRPKKLVAEIFKRFFKNPYVVVAFAVFITIILMAIIIPQTSPYFAVTPVSDGSVSPFYRNLPPSYSPFISSPNPDIVNRINDYKNPSYFGGVLSQYVASAQDVTGQAFSQTYSYDAYQFFFANSLDRLLLARFNSDSTIVPPQAVLDQLKSQIVIPYTILGTDANGYDVWTNNWVGTGQSIALSIIVSTFAMAIGASIGAVLGFHAGKWIDTLFMRLIDIFTSPPTLLWILIFVSLFGTSNTALGIILVVTSWPAAVTGTRLFIITVKDNEFITASRSIGASKVRLIYGHALPTILGKIANQYVQMIPSNILAVSSLAFLGFFNARDSANLGQLLQDSVEQLGNNFWMLLLPSLILVFLSISLYFISVGVHDALDPKIIR